MKIIFFSYGRRINTLIHLLEKDFNIIKIVISNDSNKNDQKKFDFISKKFGVDIVKVSKHNIYEKIEKIEFDILISCGFNFILEKRVLNKAKKISINVHPTLLPKYRGYRSGPFIIMNNEKYSGVTIHKISEGIDNGDIIKQQKFKLTKFDTTKSLSRKAYEIEPKLLESVLYDILSNNIKLIKQDEKKATTFKHLREPKDSEIDPNKSLNELYDFIRSCDFKEYPAFFYVENEKVLIRLTRETKDDPFNDLI